MTAFGQLTRGRSTGRIGVRSGTEPVIRALTEHAALLGRTAQGGVTSTGAWLAASVHAGAPWLLTVSDDTGRTAGAALLVDSARGGYRHTLLAGSAEGHRGWLHAVDDEAARTLGSALAAVLESRQGEFTLGPLRAGPTVDALLGDLAVPTLVEDVEVPQVRLASGEPYGMSRGMLRTLRKATNRLDGDGVSYHVTASADRDAILSMLPLMEHISRERDHAAGRTSPLDGTAGRRTWQRRVQALAALGLLRLATLHLDDDVAAYVLGIHDGATYRIFEGRYVGRWARYVPGRLLEAAVVRQIAAAGRHHTLDWMTAIAPESLLATNAAERLVVVRGRV